MNTKKNSFSIEVDLDVLPRRGKGKSFKNVVESAVNSKSIKYWVWVRLQNL